MRREMEERVGGENFRREDEEIGYREVEEGG